MYVIGSHLVRSLIAAFFSQVFIINPENKLMLSLNYPACVGRNMDEIVRCVQALQLSYEKVRVLALFCCPVCFYLQSAPVFEEHRHPCQLAQQPRRDPARGRDADG